MDKQNNNQDKKKEDSKEQEGVEYLDDEMIEALD
jgi:hypothetical protein